MWPKITQKREPLYSKNMWGISSTNIQNVTLGTTGTMNALVETWHPEVPQSRSLFVSAASEIDVWSSIADKYSIWLDIYQGRLLYAVYLLDQQLLSSSLSWHNGMFGFRNALFCFHFHITTFDAFPLVICPNKLRHYQNNKAPVWKYIILSSFYRMKQGDQSLTSLSLNNWSKNTHIKVKCLPHGRANMYLFQASVVFLFMGWRSTLKNCS